MIRLIFFDIDGTLIYHTHADAAFRLKRYSYAIKQAWNIDVPIELPKYEGWIDRGLTWEVISRYGITRSEFLSKMPHFTAAMRHYMDISKDEADMYRVIPEAESLLKRLSHFPKIHAAVLTGNVEEMGWWKLEHVGLKKYIQFGIFGDDADNKIDLGSSAIVKAELFFHEHFPPEAVAVIGDTPFDIECGKAMGVAAVGVITGKHNVTSEQFKTSGADIVVTSLMDPALMHFLGIA